MADDATIAGKTWAADNISDKLYLRQKLIHGADGTNDGDVALTNPLPVNAALNTGILQSGSSQLTPIFTRVELTADANIIAASAGDKLRVLAMTVNTEVANDDIEMEDGNGGTNLWNFLNIPLGVAVLPFNPMGWFETTAGSALWGNVTLAGATQINVAVVYVKA